MQNGEVTRKSKKEAPQRTRVGSCVVLERPSSSLQDEAGRWKSINWHTVHLHGLLTSLSILPRELPLALGLCSGAQLGGRRKTIGLN